MRTNTVPRRTKMGTSNREKMPSAYRASEKGSHPKDRLIWAVFDGGGEGSRTPVRKPVDETFSERSGYFKIPLTRPLTAKYALW